MAKRMHEAVNVGPAQSLLFGAMAHENSPRKSLCQASATRPVSSGELSSTTSTDNPGQCQREQLRDQSRQILGFVIGGDHDDGLRVLGDVT